MPQGLTPKPQLSGNPYGFQTQGTIAAPQNPITSNIILPNVIGASARPKGALLVTVSPIDGDINLKYYGVENNAVLEMELAVDPTITPMEVHRLNLLSLAAHHDIGTAESRMKFIRTYALERHFNIRTVP